MPKTVTLKKSRPDDLGFPIRLMGKAEIEQAMVSNLNTALEKATAPQLYLVLKQIEFAIGVGLEQLKPVAIDAFVEAAGDRKSATIDGHKVEVKSLFDYDYGKAYNDLKEAQKAALAVVKAEAERDGCVTKTSKGKTIAVSLRP